MVRIPTEKPPVRPKRKMAQRANGGQQGPKTGKQKSADYRHNAQEAMREQAEFIEQMKMELPDPELAAACHGKPSEWKRIRMATDIMRTLVKLVHERDATIAGLRAQLGYEAQPAPVRERAPSPLPEPYDLSPSLDIPLSPGLVEDGYGFQQAVQDAAQGDLDGQEVQVLHEQYVIVQDNVKSEVDETTLQMYNAFSPSVAVRMGVQEQAVHGQGCLTGEGGVDPVWSNEEFPEVDVNIPLFDDGMDFSPTLASLEEELGVVQGGFEESIFSMEVQEALGTWQMSGMNLDS